MGALLRAMQERTEAMTGTRWKCTVCLTGYDESPHVCDLPAAVQRLAEELRQARYWEDVNDEWTSQIKAAHPTRSGSHDEYGIAMKMVGHRHSKGELVSLVNWLLRDFNKAVEVACAASNDAESALREAGLL